MREGVMRIYGVLKEEEGVEDLEEIAEENPEFENGWRKRGWGLRAGGGGEVVFER